MAKKILLGAGVLAGLVILSVFGFLGYLTLTSDKPGPDFTTKAPTPKPEKPSHVDIHPFLKEIPGGFVFGNKTDPFGYKDITVTVNDDYEYKLPQLRQKGTVVVRWRDLADNDGNRFSIASKKVKSLKITTTTTNGDFGLLIKLAP